MRCLNTPGIATSEFRSIYEMRKVRQLNTINNFQVDTFMYK